MASDEAFGQRGIGRSRIDDKPATSRHDVRRRRLDRQDADGGDEIIRPFAASCSAIRRTDETVAAAATSASWRSPIGVVPA